jgi:superfamily I DNA/RNA helicase
MFSFSLPPTDSLTREQQGVLGIEYDGALIVTGCPGSGKTTVTNRKVLTLRNRQGLNWTYFVYVRLLKQMIINSLKVEDNNLNVNNIATIHKWYSNNTNRRMLSHAGLDDIRTAFSRNRKDLVLIDEAQDLNPKIFEALDSFAGRLMITCDNKQNIFGYWDSNEPVEVQIRESLESNRWNVRSFHFTKNFRNTQNIYTFAYNFIRPIMVEDEVVDFVKGPGAPVVVGLCQNAHQMMEKLVGVLNANRSVNVGVLCEYSSQVDQISTVLQRRGVSFSKFHNELNDDEVLGLTKDDTSNVILTTLAASKGLEFNLVVIPFSNGLNVNRVDRKRNEVARKLYYVAMTRASDNLILLTDSPNLSNALATLPANTFLKREL